MQIRGLVLYDKTGKQNKVIKFNLGEVNIISGRSRTGKTALIDIIEYCLGRKSCKIPAGVLRKKVSWYGLHLQFSNFQLFVARKNPFPKHSTTNQIYFEQGDIIKIPSEAPKGPNTTVEVFVQHLDGLLGISPNLHEPSLKHTRYNLEATIKHALFYCFQAQDEITAKRFLFHRQSDDFIPQAIKDTLPYFLGAVQENDLALKQELKKSKQEERRAEKILNEANLIEGRGTQKGYNLFHEAKQVGLIIDSMQIPKSLNDLVVVFNQILKWTPKQSVFPEFDQIKKLQNDVTDLYKDLQETSESIKAAKTFAQESEGFTGELEEQRLRLESINLFKKGTPNDICPLCDQKLSMNIPTAKEIYQSIDEIDKKLTTTARDKPKVRNYIKELENQKGEIKRIIDEKNQAIHVLVQEKEKANEIRDVNIRCGKVLGRISLWLESIDISDNISELKNKFEKAKEKRMQLEREYEETRIESILPSLLTRISIELTKLARQLKLEYSENQIFLDLNKLTIVSEGEFQPVYLYDMGSGENWMGYHVITHLVLHKFFCLQNRPVPRFLLLDQPSSVYFASSTQNNQDFQALKRVYDLIFQVVDELSPHFQVIIIDHGVDEQFGNWIVEDMNKKGNGLVPSHWMELNR